MVLLLFGISAICLEMFLKAVLVIVWSQNKVLDRTHIFFETQTNGSFYFLSVAEISVKQ